VVLVGLAIGWIVRSGPATVAEIGSPAPDFTVELTDGGAFTLSEHRGGPVVVNLWASWCEPCRTEIPAISAFAATHPDVVVVGVAVEDADDASRAFAEEIGAGYPLALGNPAFEDAYPRIGLPVTYVLDERGVVSDIYNGIIDDEILGGLVD